MEGARGPPMLWSNIPPPACKSRPRARAMCVLSEQQGRWELLRAAEENAWPGGIELKTLALIPC
jgi:hypothetical protein